MSNGFGNMELICDLHKSSFGGMRGTKAEQGQGENESELAELCTSENIPVDGHLGCM